MQGVKGTGQSGRSRRDRERRDRRRQAGLCPTCGKRPFVVGKTLCDPCRLARNASVHRYRLTTRGKERTDFWVKRWIKKNPEMRREQSLRCYQKLREEVFGVYGKVCGCCGESDIKFLTIDHIAGGGRRHTGAIKTTLYAWLRREGFPKGFQTLCWNCNAAKHIYGRCPHQEVCGG